MGRSAKNTVDAFWNAIIKRCDTWNKASKKRLEQTQLWVNEDKKTDFENKFDHYYNTIKDDFMTSSTKALDAHKQAAIFVVSAVESGIVEQSAVTSDRVPFGAYGVVLDVALSYLLDKTNEKLRRFGKKIDQFQLPVALACETHYFDIMRRILYFEFSDAEKIGITYRMNYNIVEWAEKFFLLDYINLIQNGVDPSLLKDSIASEEP